MVNSAFVDRSSHLKFGAHKRPASAKLNAPMVLMFLYGAGWSLSFDFGVRVYVAEMVALIGLVMLNLSSVWREHKIMQSVLAAYAVWVAAIILSDYVNDTALIDFARNVSTPIIGGASLVFVVASLTRRPTAAFAFLIATVLAKAIFGDAAYGDTFSDVAVDFETIQKDTNIFKVRIDPFLTPALLLVSCFLIRSGKLRSAAFLAFCSLCYFVLDARSSAMLLVLTSALIWVASIGYRPNPRQLVTALALTFPTLYVAYLGYVEYTLEFNPNGHNGKQLLRLDNPYNPFSLLMQARSEWLVWPVAFADKPIFGWGSWAVDVDGRFEAMRALMTDQGERLIAYNRWDQGYIPVHSMVGTALVWSGMAGLIAAMMLLRTILRLMYHAPSVAPVYLPIAGYFAFMLLFHFLFSPPQHVRITFPFALGVLIVATAAARKLARGKKERRRVVHIEAGAAR